MATTMDMAMESGGIFPVRFDVPPAESLTKLTFVKWILAVPHFVILWALNYVFQILSLIALFAILFTGKYPEGMFNFNVGIRRWYANTFGYIAFLRDEYPPFAFDAGQYPVTLEIDYDESPKRWAPLYQWLLAIPHLIIVSVLCIAALIAIIIAGFSVLFSGEYPEGMRRFVVGVARWNERVTTYTFFMHNVYPPFSLEA
jgi:hypothetical protein